MQNDYTLGGFPWLLRNALCENQYILPTFVVMCSQENKWDILERLKRDHPEIFPKSEEEFLNKFIGMHMSEIKRAFDVKITARILKIKEDMNDDDKLSLDCVYWLDTIQQLQEYEIAKPRTNNTGIDWDSYTHLERECMNTKDEIAHRLSLESPELSELCKYRCKIDKYDELLTIDEKKKLYVEGVMRCQNYDNYESAYKTVEAILKLILPDLL